MQEEIDALLINERTYLRGTSATPWGYHATTDLSETRFSAWLKCRLSRGGRTEFCETFIKISAAFEKIKATRRGVSIGELGLAVAGVFSHFHCPVRPQAKRNDLIQAGEPAGSGRREASNGVF